MKSHPAIVRYQEALVQAAMSLWPALEGQAGSLRPKLFPALDSRRGDLETDFCVEIAALVRRPPGEIAGMLCGKLPGEIQAQCCRGERYFGFHLSVRTCLELLKTPPGAVSGTKGKKQLVFVPRPSHALAGWPHFRLAVCGCLQFLMLSSLGEEASLYYGSEALCSFPAAIEAGHILEELLTFSLSHAGLEPRKATFEAACRMLEQGGKAAAHLWLSTESIERGKFHALMAQARDAGIDLNVISPPRTWFAHFDQSVPLAALSASWPKRWSASRPTSASTPCSV